MKIIVSVLSSILTLYSPIAANMQPAVSPVEEPTATVSYAEDEPSVCILTQLDIYLATTTNNKMRVTLTNTFTLFPSTVKVMLQLYSSTTKTTDITEMDLEGTTTSDDLNMGESISVTSASTINRYWVGYAIYYKSSTDKVVYQTDTEYF